MTNAPTSPSAAPKDGEHRRSLARLREMQRIRAFEEEVLRLRLEGTVVGSVHLCNGQEGIYVGACEALDIPRDLVFPTYRGHGWALACGADPFALFAELLGRADGINGGRGGSAYFFAPSVGMMGENSIVGAGAPIASGAALAGLFDGSNRVTLAAFGDGAVNQGSVHEAMNFASVMKLPVIFLIENNHWSELTPITATTTSDRLYKRASAYGIKGVRIDGNDPRAVAATVAQAADFARGGGGPVVIEAMTDRIVGHYIGDAQTYRAPGEMERIMEAEPIARLSRELIAAEVAPSAIAAVIDEANAEIQAASRAAQLSPPADPSTATEHLYA